MRAADDTLQRPIILIVEDQAVMRAMLRELVQNEFPDCSILDAASGAQAMALCARHEPTLVLMDVRLPDADGIGLTARITTTMPSVSVIVVSYLCAEPYVEQALAAGAVAYIIKDHLLSELMPAVAGVVHRSAP